MATAGGGRSNALGHAKVLKKAEIPLFKVQYDMIGGHEMAISKQYLQLFDVKPWSHHHQKATIERAPTTVTPPPRHATTAARATPP